MKKNKNLEILINYIFQKMLVVSDKEFRLTTYLLTILIYTKQTHCWIYFNELIEGRDKFIGSTKKEKILNGVGLSKKDLIYAIKEVNSRGIIKIESQYFTNYLLKISLNAKTEK